MSRSLSREERRQLRRERRNTEFCEVVPVVYAERTPEPEVITPEWAVARMEDQVSFKVAQLLQQGCITDAQMDDYEQMFKLAILDALPKYDPERKASNGRTSSATHFMTVVLEKTVAKAIESIECARKAAEMIPIETLDDESESQGAIRNAVFSLDDRGEFVERLDFEMDMATIATLLPARERKVFLLVLQGYNHLEICAAIGMGKSAYYEFVIPAIAKVLVRCGYGPKRGT